MSDARSARSSEAHSSEQNIETPSNDLINVDVTASENASSRTGPSRQDIALVNSNSDQPREISATVAPAQGSSQIPLQSLEEAARQAQQQSVPPSVTAHHGPTLQQYQAPPAAYNARPIAPAPARMNGPAQHIQPAPPQHSQPAPQPQPQVFYPYQPGTPLLMNQCPRCGLRAGEPFRPMYYPQNTDAFPPRAPTPPPMPKQKKSNIPPRGPDRTGLHLHPPPPDHPNAHMWIPPPGYIPPPPPAQMPASLSMLSPGVSSYSATPVHPDAPTYPHRKNPDRGALPPHVVSSRLPSPPPARRPLTLVDSNTPQEILSSQTHTAGGRRRKSEKPYRRRMSRDERRDILLMRKLGYKMEQIARYLGTTVSAVNYTIRQGDPEPKHKNAGRKVNIPKDRIDAMVAYVKDYMEREKACPVDKRTGRKTMKHLSYNMIRQAVFADENGEIPCEFKFTDDALKSTLNKRGVWLRAPMSQQMIEVARARGKKLWAEKLEKDRLAAEAAARNGTQVEDANNASGGYIEADQMGLEGEPNEDDEMEGSSDDDDDSISIPSDGGGDQDEEPDHQDRMRERRDFQPTSMAMMH